MKHSLDKTIKLIKEKTKDQIENKAYNKQDITWPPIMRCILMPSGPRHSADRSDFQLINISRKLQQQQQSRRLTELQAAAVRSCLCSDFHCQRGETDVLHFDLVLLRLKEV